MRRRRRRWRWMLLLLIPVAGIVEISRVMPLVETMAAAQVENEASDLIAECITAQMERNDISYDSIVQLEKDAGGKLVALRTDMGQLNRLRNETLGVINQKLVDGSESELGIPLGNVLFPTLFSGHGPMLPVRILMVGNSDAEFVSHFQEEGINQTLHQIRMQVGLKITMLTPAGTQTVQVATDVVVAETVLLGQVPNTMIDTRRNGE